MKNLSFKMFKNIKTIALNVTYTFCITLNMCYMLGIIIIWRQVMLAPNPYL